MGMKVAYARVSSDPDGSSVSPEAQLSECIEEARRRGWDPAEVRELVDRDLSAWKRTVNRPAWAELVEGISEGLIDGVIVHHLDRLLRQVRDLEALIEAIEARGGRFPIYSVHGDLDLSTPDGRAMARILVTIAQKESDDKSRRLQLVLGAKAREGRSHGGTRPYGYDPDDRRRTLPGEREVVLQLARWTLDGRSLGFMVRELNAAGIPSPSGKSRWHHQVVRRLLLSPRYAGLRTHKGQVVAEGDWEAIIDLETHTRIVEILDRSSPHPRTRQWWGSARMVCGRCETKMSSIPHTTGRRYSCPKRVGGCGSSIAAGPVDEILSTVIGGLLELGWGRLTTAQYDTAEVDQARRDLAVAESRLAELGNDYYVAHTIDRATFEPTNRALVALTADLRAKIDAPRPVLELGAAESWEAAPVSRKVELLGRVIDRTVIQPVRKGVNRFDPTRVEIHLTT